MLDLTTPDNKCQDFQVPQPFQIYESVAHHLLHCFAHQFHDTLQTFQQTLFKTKIYILFYSKSYIP